MAVGQRWDGGFNNNDGGTTSPNCEDTIEFPEAVVAYAEELASALGMEHNNMTTSNITLCQLFEFVVQTANVVLANAESLCFNLSTEGVESISLEAACDKTIMEVYDEVEAIIYSDFVNDRHLDDHRPAAHQRDLRRTRRPSGDPGQLSAGVSLCDGQPLHDFG